MALISWGSHRSRLAAGTPLEARSLPTTAHQAGEESNEGKHAVNHIVRMLVHAQGHLGHLEVANLEFVASTRKRLRLVLKELSEARFICSSVEEFLD
jgi:hypothetical protein